jgi:hypothetical protein
MGETGFGLFRVRCECAIIWKLADNRLEQRKVTLPDAEVGPLATGFAFQQPGTANDLDMTGNGGLRHVENVGQFADTQRAVHHQPDNTPAGFVRQRPEKTNRFIHDGIYRYDYSRNVKPCSSAISPGIAVEKTASDWTVSIPGKYHVGDETHYEQVAENSSMICKAVKCHPGSSQDPGDIPHDEPKMR